MKQLRREKNWEHFLEKIQNLSESRKLSIRQSNQWFGEYCEKNYDKTLDELIAYAKTLSIDDSEEIVLEVLQDWMNHLHSKKLVVSTIRLYLVSVVRYLKYYKIRIDLKDLDWPQHLKEEPYAITLQEIQQIINIAPWSKKAYYFSLISTGARPIEILSLRKKDITWHPTTNDYTAIIPAKYTKKKMARTIKFSHEVTPFLKQMLSELELDSMVFTKNPILRNAQINEDLLMLKYCRKLGLTEKYETTGRSKINLYCFRAYFFTKVQRLLGDETAHALIGHGAYLQQYQRRTIEEKIELWDELESEVLVFDQSKNEEKIKKLKEANTRITDLEDENKIIKARQVNLERLIIEKLHDSNLDNLVMPDENK